VLLGLFRFITHHSSHHNLILIVRIRKSSSNSSWNGCYG